MYVKTKLLSSLDKVFLDEEPTQPAWTSMSMLKGETSSFQWVATVDEGSVFEAVISVESPLKEYIRAYTVGHVPSQFPAYSHSDDNFLRRTPGLYPDVLFPCEDGVFNLMGGQWRGVWIEIDLPDDAPAGIFPIRLCVKSIYDPQYFAEEEFTLHVLEAVLPNQTLICTEWFHCDCLSVYYNVPVFSEQHWTLMRNYMENAAHYGANMILVPVFTPPLDTQVGGERPTVQLVDVNIVEDGYTFGFEKLDRYLDMAMNSGFSYFEISHLFTQWGAGHAPKIVAHKDGVEVKLFGWETDAGSSEYLYFLNTFLTELKTFLNKKGVLDHCRFHVSDEPSSLTIDSYARARNGVKDVLSDCCVMDALSDISFYHDGLVPCPIPALDHIEPFLSEGLSELWAYYCCGQTVDVSNRLMAMPSARNRILGWQLYKYNVKGFLHWGYNFWFTALSKKAINPYAVTDAGALLPSGDPFIVYPGDDGRPVPSIRQLVFFDALQDMRALQLLESFMSHEEVVAWLDAECGYPLTFSKYPHDSRWLLDSRQKLNQKIDRLISNAKL